MKGTCLFDCYIILIHWTKSDIIVTQILFFMITYFQSGKKLLFFKIYIYFFYPREDNKHFVLIAVADPGIYKQGGASPVRRRWIRIWIKMCFPLTLSDWLHLPLTLYHSRLYSLYDSTDVTVALNTETLSKTTDHIQQIRWPQSKSKCDIIDYKL